MYEKRTTVSFRVRHYTLWDHDFFQKNRNLERKSKGVKQNHNGPVGFIKVKEKLQLRESDNMGVRLSKYKNGKKKITLRPLMKEMLYTKDEKKDISIVDYVTTSSPIYKPP